jgi:hypothetical protein
MFAMDQIFCGVVLNDISPEDFVKKIIRNIKAALIKTLPSKNVAVELPYKLYFAKESRSWDGMGVAFIDLKYPGKTPGRAYLINEDQLNDIQNQEGPWYQIFKLGTIEGRPAFTLTGSEKYEERLPSEKYLDTIKRGLKELEELEMKELKIKVQ